MKMMISLIAIFSVGSSFAQGDIIVDVATAALSKVEKNFIRHYKPCKGISTGPALSYRQTAGLRVDTPNNDLKNYTVLVPYSVNCGGISKSAFATINVEFNFSHCDDQMNKCWVADIYSIKAVEFREKKILKSINLINE